VVLRREEQGPAIAVEFVSDRDLVDARAELWFEAFLRNGHLDVPVEAVQAPPRPIHGRTEAGAPVCLGFSLACEAPDRGGAAAASEHRCVFPRAYLEPVAARMARRLRESGTLATGDTYFYELSGRPQSETAPRIPVRRGAAAVLASGAGGPEFFSALHTPLAPLVERAEEVNAEYGVADDYPVFFTREAREKAESAARRGALSRPPVETGGLFVGPLCSCPETGAMFAVVVDVLEAAHSEGTTYSLTYSGKTWARIQAVMRAKQAHEATRSHRLLGQVHGHSFLPMEGAEPCEACAALPVCTRTTAYLSLDDIGWCRAVFHGEPWQLSQVYGLDARGGGVEAFYGQRGGRLVRRSYFILDDFDV
jgi:hypothetical protein